MFVICNGMPRSASTWSFNVVRALLNDTDTGSFCGYDENLDRFCRSVPLSVRNVLLKCHSLDPTGLALTRTGAAKLVFTWRDPMDATASFMEMFEPDFERAFAVIKSSLDLMVEHRNRGNAILLAYDDIIASGAGAVQRIVAYLGLNTDSARVSEIANEVGIDRMRAKVEEIGNLDYGPKLIRHEHMLYDPVTLLHIDHIRHSGSGYGRERLSPAQIARIEALAASACVYAR